MVHKFPPKNSEVSVIESSTPFVRNPIQPQETLSNRDSSDCHEESIVPEIDFSHQLLPIEHSKSSHAPNVNFEANSNVCKIESKLIYSHEDTNWDKDQILDEQQLSTSASMKIEHHTPHIQDTMLGIISNTTHKVFYIMSL